MKCILEMGYHLNRMRRVGRFLGMLFFEVASIINERTKRERRRVGGMEGMQGCKEAKLHSENIVGEKECNLRGKMKGNISGGHQEW